MTKKQLPQTQKSQLLNPSSFNHSLMFPKRQWTSQQDNLLSNAILIHGAKRWSFIAQFVPGRLGKQCRQRWCNHLDPKINKDQWMYEEEWLLFLMYYLQGGKWAKMTKILTSRTDNSIKNHWNSIMQKKINNFKQRLDSILAQQFSQFELISESSQFKNKQLFLIKRLKQKSVKLNYTNKRQSGQYQFDDSFMQNECLNNQDLLKFQQKPQSSIQPIVLAQTTSDFYLHQKTIPNQQPFQSILTQYQQPYRLLSFIPLNFKSSSQSQGFDKKQSFVDRKNICNSPQIKHRYSQIYRDQEEENYDVVEEIAEPLLLKIKSSKNYILTSPSKFMERNNSLR